LNTHHTKHKGDIGEAAVTLDLIAKGYIVSRPLTECAPYDLIADNGKKLVRIQVKYRDSGKIPRSNSWADKNGTHTVDMDPNSFDYIALVNSKLVICYCLPDMMGKSISYQSTRGTSSYWYGDFQEMRTSTPKKKPSKQAACKWPVTKQQLRKLIWQAPVSQLALKLGVSVTAINKLCRELQIAKPPRNHWSKKHGHT
jgi:hypothetical protein